MHAGQTWRLGHRPALDGLRGVAILLVLIAHGGINVGEAAGNVGVTMFFVLSGFLIASLLLEELRATGGVRLGRFYRRRALRLLPALLTMVVVVSAVAAWVVPGFTAADMQLGSIFYASNWLRVSGHGFADALGHTWSLSIEEQFYFVAPFVIIALRRRPKVLGWLCAVGMAGSLVLRAVLMSGDGARVYFGADCRVDALLAGVGVAVLMHSRRRQPRAVPVVATACASGAIAACCLVSNTSALYFVLVPSIVSSATMVVILHALSAPRSVLARPVLRWFGRRSYGLYLWHYPATILALHVDSHRWVVFVAMLASIPVAELSWRFVEQPFLRLKDRQDATPHAPEPSQLVGGAAPVGGPSAK